MNKLIKVVYIVTTVDGFGADKSILANLGYLKLMGLIDPIVIIPASGAIEKDLLIQGIRYHVIPFKSWFCGSSWFFWKVIKRTIKIALNHLLSYHTSHLLRSGGIIDIVHTNTFTTNFGILLAHQLNAQHVMHIRELPIQQFSWNYEFGEKRTSYYTDKHSVAVYANSEYVKSSFVPLFQKKTIQVLNNPIDGNDRVDNPNSYSFSDGINIIAMGRFHQDKQLYTAIDAVEILHKEGLIGFKLCIYGDGEQKSFMEEKIRVGELDSIVNIFPYKRDLHSILHKFHIGLITSRCEAFGRATIEYMDAGLAVIGNETGNTPYLIDHGITGLIAEFGNPASLAACIKRLIHNESEIQRYGKAAFQKVTQQYTIESSSRRLHQLYKESL